MEEQYLVSTVSEPVDWTVEVPGSKSMTNRALLMAALSDGTVKLEGVLFSEDSRHFLDSLKLLGFGIITEEKEKRVLVTGGGGRIPKKEAEINVGSAGTAARFLTAMLGFSDGVYTIQASKQMKRRPMKPLFDLLTGMGARITCLEQEGFLPIRIEGNAYPSEAKVHEENLTQELFTELDISRSTQFLSALLLISPMVKQGLFIHITSEKTDGSYIRITRNMMREFGVTVDFDGINYRVPKASVYKKEIYTVEPDMSAACYFYGAAALTGGRALVKRVHRDNSQGDLKFLSVLQEMGCTIDETEDGIEVKGPAGSSLSGVTVDMNDFSDQALTLAALAPFCAGRVRIENIAHIRLQECDRIHAITAELSKLGITCEEENGAVTIYPGIPGPGVIETYDDHRVAMAFSLIGLRVNGIIISHPSCCRKTFEEYFTLLTALTT